MRRFNRYRRFAFVQLEVLISILLISMGMASIVGAFIRSAKILRASREVAAASQVLQQRIEMIRDQPWNEIVRSDTMAELMGTPTNSEAELPGANLTEILKVTVPVNAKNGGVTETDREYSIRRENGTVTVLASGDFSEEPTLLFEGTARWQDKVGWHERVLRTVICRMGLTRSGIVGATLGLPGNRVSKRL